MSSTLRASYSHERGDSAADAGGGGLGPSAAAGAVSAGELLRQERTGDDFLRIVSREAVERNERLSTLAAKGELLDLQRMLSEGGLDPSHCGLGGFTALHYACQRGNVAIAHALVKAGFDINAQNDSGETPLHIAAFGRFPLLVELLVDNGAGINAGNNYGETPLFYAARRNQPTVVRILLSRGADASITDRSGDTAADQAEDAATTALFAALPPVEAPGHLPYDVVVRVFTYLSPNELVRCGMVCCKWQRASEAEELWSRLGVRRWELALHNSLGFAPAAAASFRPRTSSSKAAARAGGSSVAPPLSVFRIPGL